MVMNFRSLIKSKEVQTKNCHDSNLCHILAIRVQASILRDFDSKAATITNCTSMIRQKMIAIQKINVKVFKALKRGHRSAMYFESEIQISLWVAFSQ